MTDFSFRAENVIVFCRMLQRLQLPPELDGRIWRYDDAAAANRRHRHIELELNLVTSGSGTYLLGSRRYQIRRGDLLWLFPAQEHVLIEQTPDFGMWIAVFRRRAVKRSATDAVARPLLLRSLPGESCRRLAPHDLTRFEDLFADLSQLSGQPGLTNAGLAYTLLHAWQCFERASGVPARELHPAIEKAARLIRDGDRQDGTLDQIAHDVGLSASRLSRLFKEQTGSNLVDFRNRQRVARFQELYGAGSRRTLLEAALDAGFGSYPQFHRVIRQTLGCSPKEYARRARNEPYH